MPKGLQDKFRGAWAKISGKEKREQDEAAAVILAEHEARADFGVDECIDRLAAIFGEVVAKQRFADYAARKIEAVVKAALADKALDPQEDAMIARVLERYGNPKIDPESAAMMDRARALHHAMTAPLAPVHSPLLLRKGEYCVFGVQAEALEERSRTVRVNYGGPSARVRIVKGVYYTMGSVRVARETESFHHSFGEGVLAATNKRLLWVSPGKTISIALPKIVMFEPFSDGVKIHKDTGKPLMFGWPKDNGLGSVMIGRVIEELRD